MYGCQATYWTVPIFLIPKLPISQINDRENVFVHYHNDAFAPNEYLHTQLQ